jgi:hypothetical protein
LKGISDPAGTRTQGPYIKSVLLYQLSYEIWYVGLKTELFFFLICQEPAYKSLKNIAYAIASAVKRIAKITVSVLAAKNYLKCRVKINGK